MDGAMKRMKTYGIIALCVLFLIVVIQNAESVDVRFLGWTLSMSRALLFPMILFTGFCLGYLVAKWPRKPS